MKKPLISVIMPTYNTPKIFFEPAISSILKQTYKNLELIIVDDGSITDIKSIVNKIKDKRIKYINHGHNGAGIARNIGIKCAKGDFIYVMASDDTLDNDTFETCINLVNKYDPDIVLFNLYGQNNGEIQFFNAPVPFNITNPGDTTQFVRKELILKNDIKYENFTSCNDLTFTYTILACAKHVVKINKCFYHYNTDVPTQISATRGSKAKNLLLAFDALERNLKRKNLLNIYKKQLNLCLEGCISYELGFIYDKNYRKDFLKSLKSQHYDVYKKLFPWYKKIFRKQKLNNGQRIIYLFGIKIFNYRKKR